MIFLVVALPLVCALGWIVFSLLPERVGEEAAASLFAFRCSLAKAGEIILDVLTGLAALF